MMAIFFTKDQKLSFAIEKNFKIVRILKQLGIRPGFGEKSINDVCHSNNVSPDLFTAILNMTTYTDYEVDSESLSILPTTQLLNYLKLSHKEFINKDLPYIEHSLKEMLSSPDFSYSHSSVFIGFFDEYKSELLSHFDYEDSIVFPYVNGILEGEKFPGYSIEKFKENHTNIESKLSDLKNILLKYFPFSKPYPILYDIVENLYQLEQEFENHAYLEERLLVPHVEFLERRNN